MNIKLRQSEQTLFIRNVIFGVEDSLVSTVGLLSGIASATPVHTTVMLTGTIYIVVEAFSMAAGSFLSEWSAEELEKGKRKKLHQALVGASVMLVSFIVAGLIPFAPYFFLSNALALFSSIVVSLAVLVGVGIWASALAHSSKFKGALRMLTVGGLVIALGLAIGHMVPVPQV